MVQALQAASILQCCMALTGRCSAGALCHDAGDQSYPRTVSLFGCPPPPRSRIRWNNKFSVYRLGAPGTASSLNALCTATAADQAAALVAEDDDSCGAPRGKARPLGDGWSASVRNWAAS